MMRWFMLGLTILGFALTFTRQGPGLLAFGLLFGFVGFFGLVFSLAADRVSATRAAGVDDGRTRRSGRDARAARGAPSRRQTRRRRKGPTPTAVRGSGPVTPPTHRGRRGSRSLNVTPLPHHACRLASGQNAGVAAPRHHEGRFDVTVEPCLYS